MSSRPRGMALTDTIVALARGTWSRFAAARTPAALYSAVEAALALSDAVARETQVPPLAGVRQPACTPGCAWCCHYQVGLTAPQALHISAKVAAGDASLPAATLTGRLKRLDAVTRGLDSGARLKARRPCAFLENGSCTIYAFRPFGCRGANSFDAELCQAFVEGRADAGASGGGWVHLPAYEAQRDLQDGFHAGALLQGLRDDRLELTSAVLTALETPDAAERWIAGEDVFEGARLPD